MLKNFLTGLALAAFTTLALAAGTDYPPQSVEGNGVKVTVAPRGIGPQTWDFEVVVETHARSLDEDIAGVSLLVADGERYRPVTWVGAPPGGHHRKGLLRFNAVAPRPPMLELQIRLEGDASPRSFSWILE
ncbi:MAG TPA: hypothetical protein VGD24_02660 [Gallionella sp.]